MSIAVRNILLFFDGSLTVIEILIIPSLFLSSENLFIPGFKTSLQIKVSPSIFHSECLSIVLNDLEREGKLPEGTTGKSRFSLFCWLSNNTEEIMLAWIHINPF